MNLPKSTAIVDANKAARKNQPLGKYYDRPQISFGQIWCAQCQKPCEFDETCLHNAANPGSSKLVMRAYCHGDECDLICTFQQWHDAKEKRIVVFGDGNALMDAEPAQALPPAPEIEPSNGSKIGLLEIDNQSESRT